MDLSAWCLAMAMYSEARGESIIGQIAVAEVVLTRAELRKMDTCQVIYETKQFSGIKDTKIKDTKLFDQIYRLAATLIKLPDAILSHGATHFHAINMPRPVWTKSMKVYATIGNHIFYVETKIPDTKGSKVPRPGLLSSLSIPPT